MAPSAPSLVSCRPLLAVCQHGSLHLMADLQMKSSVGSDELSQKEAKSEIYDRQFLEEEQSRRHYRHSICFPLYRQVCWQLDASPNGQILEVGCGTGAFAHCVLEHLGIPYRGFDFS